MRFSTIFVYLAVAVGLAIAGPLADRDAGPSLKDVGNSTQPNPGDPKGQKSPTHAGPEGEEVKIRIFGEKGATTKREDYNPLNERGHATLYLCHHRGCNGWCQSYELEDYDFDVCYWVSHYRSLYVRSHHHLYYGVYVGYYCQRTFSPRTFTYLFGAF